MVENLRYLQIRIRLGKADFFARRSLLISAGPTGHLSTFVPMKPGTVPAGSVYLRTSIY